MAQQSGVAPAYSTAYRESVGEEVAAHVEDAVVEPEVTLAVEEKELPAAFEKEVAAPIEEPATVAAKAPEAPIEGEKVAEVAPEMEKTEAAAALAEEAASAVEEAAPVVEIVVEDVAAPAEKAVGDREAARAVEEELPDAGKPKHTVFLSHSGEQKAFVERLCVALEGCYLYPFFDKRDHSLPIGDNFAVKIFDAIKECHVGVVILSKKFFTSKWPMMELVAMVDQVEKTKGFFKIVPIFYGISTEEIDDPKHRNEWLLAWDKLAIEKSRGVDVARWVAALDYIRPINGLKFDGLSDLGLENKIVDVICELVPPEIRLDDTHIQGRDRLCKVIQDKIDAWRKVKINGVCVVGLYGMGGIGKTSICKVLCNKFFTKFRGRVCHAELGKKSEEELMREVLKKLADTSYERLYGFDVDKMRNVLNDGIIKEAVFLAIDSMSDTYTCIDQVKSYLSARLPSGSIVMVTARSLGSLIRVRPFVDENNCMEMPELKVQEAKLLFARSSNFEPNDEDDEHLLNRCVKQCYFQKDDHNKSYHYHPLALDVLGRQLGCIDPKEWGAQLHKIDKIGEDIFNQRKENSHPIFSILRTSFDTLSPDDQLLFMDIGLYLPANSHPPLDAEWLGMVHGIPSVEDVMRALERLKTKSLLDRLGDGTKTRIGMHDLWSAFCGAETKSGDLGCRRWVYETGKGNELVETSPSGTCWENMKRMALTSKLERVNFAHFPNVAVLKISGLCITKKLVVDISRLIHLKSLEVSGRHLPSLVLQGLPKDLIFMCMKSDLGESDSSRQLNAQTWGLNKHWKSRSNSGQLIKQIRYFKELQCLLLENYGGGKLPDMRSMVSMRKAIFLRCKNVVEVTGLSSKLTNLRVLYLKRCTKLRSCLGVGFLVNLVELNCKGCVRLEKLPNLRKLRNLRILDVSKCPLISEVPGLGDLVALEELYAGKGLDDNASCSFKLPDMRKLSNLRVLCLRKCRLEAVPGFESLISLQEVEADFREVVDRPRLRQLTKLQTLRIEGWSSRGLEELDYLAMLQSLEINSCCGVDKLPDFLSSNNLKTLGICYCEFKDVSSLTNLGALKTLDLLNCKKLERLPDLHRLTRLEWLGIWNCPMLRGWDCTFKGQVEGSSCRLDVTSVGFDLPEFSHRVTGLRTLFLFYCLKLESIGAFSQLESFFCSEMAVRELPDLSNFPRLRILDLYGCRSLRRLTSREPMNALSILNLGLCSRLTTLPNVSYFLGLVKLQLGGCEGITTLSSTGPLTALELLDLNDCSGLAALPDLGMFPALEKLLLERCSRLTTLGSRVPLPALKVLDARGCRSLNRDDLDQLRASCPQCEIKCDALDVETGVEKTWMWRAVGAGGMMLPLGWMFRTLRSRSRARKH